MKALPSKKIIIRRSIILTFFTSATLCRKKVVQNEQTEHSWLQLRNFACTENLGQKLVHAQILFGAMSFSSCIFWTVWNDRSLPFQRLWLLSYFLAELHHIFPSMFESGRRAAHQMSATFPNELIWLMWGRSRFPSTPFVSESYFMRRCQNI